MAKLKDKKEIQIMREAGSKLSTVMESLKKEVSPGKTTKDLEEKAKELISKEGGKPSFLGYKEFPAAICTSVNRIVVHGIPSDRVLNEGDIISIDIGLEWKGYHSDMAVTVPVGKISRKAEKLLRVTEESLDLAIKQSKKGKRLGDIGNAVEKHVTENGLVVVRGLCGHGIGKEVHENPQIMNTGSANRGWKIREGFTFCIEPMVTFENPKIYHDKEGIKTENISAHFEHTIAIVDGNPEILTA